MQFVVILLASLVAALLAAPLDNCYSTYQILVASPAASDQCLAVSGFGDCIVSILQNDTNITTLDTAEYLLSQAISTSIANNIGCQYSTDAIKPPEFAMTDSNVNINVGQGCNVSYVTFNRNTASIASIAAHITALQGNGTAIQTTLTNQASAASLAAASTLVAATSTYTSSISSVVTAASANITAALASANQLSAYLTGNQSTIVAYRQTGNAQIETEEESLLQLQFNSLTSSATQRITLQLGLNDDAADRAAISTENTFFLMAISTQIAYAISQFQAAEDAIAVSQGSSLVAATSTAQVPLLSSLSTSFVNEASRANAVATTAVNNNVIFRPFNASGALDSTACNASQEGITYFSYARSKWVFCNGYNYSNVYTAGRFFGIAGGTIMDYQQEYNLHEATGRHAWFLCYKLSRDGSSYITFHSNCDNKGGAVVVYQSSSGTIFGGYSEHGFSSNGVYYYSSINFLYRFVGDTIQIANTNGYPISNAVYHNPSAGPCFGGCDFWVGSDMRTATSCYSSYYTGTYGYSSTWLFQTGTTTLGVASAIEIYTHVLY